MHTLDCDDVECHRHRGKEAYHCIFGRGGCIRPPGIPGNPDDDDEDFGAEQKVLGDAEQDL